MRPQPALGTVEIRVMDAQTEVGATAALCALEPPFLRQLDAVERRGGRMPGLMAELAAAFAPEA